MVMHRGAHPLRPKPAFALHTPRPHWWTNSARSFTRKKGKNFECPNFSRAKTRLSWLRDDGGWLVADNK